MLPERFRTSGDLAIVGVFEFRADAIFDCVVVGAGRSYGKRFKRDQTFHRQQI